MKKSLKRFLSSFSICVLLICLTLLGNIPSAFASSGSWHKVELPVAITPLDLWFDKSEPNHGWLVGTDATLLETTDGGNTWEERKLDLGDNLHCYCIPLIAVNLGHGSDLALSYLAIPLRSLLLVKTLPKWLQIWVQSMPLKMLDKIGEP